MYYNFCVNNTQEDTLILHIAKHINTSQVIHYQGLHVLHCKTHK